MTLNEILAATPAQLFGNGDPTLAYKKLASIWHPDKGGNAKAFAHIQKAYKERKEVLDKRFFHIHDAGGASFTGERVKWEPFELGEESIGTDFVAYEMSDGNDDLAGNFRRRIDKLTFLSNRVRDYFEPLLPSTHRISSSNNRVIVVTHSKPFRLIRLSDAIPFLKENRERHVAWITSRLMNFCTYLETHGLTHNGLSSDTVYIDPKEHTMYFLGGWFYSVPIGERLIAMPKKTLDYAPPSVLRKKVGDIRTDLEMSKAIARECLGDISGSSLYKNPNLPKPMLNWLRQPCGDNALHEYQYWYDNVLDQSFGPKQFIELKLNFNDVY